MDYLYVIETNVDDSWRACVALNYSTQLGQRALKCDLSLH